MKQNYRNHLEKYTLKIIFSNTLFEILIVLYILIDNSQIPNKFHIEKHINC